MGREAKKILLYGGMENLAIWLGAVTDVDVQYVNKVIVLCCYKEDGFIIKFLF